MKTMMMMTVMMTTTREDSDEGRLTRTSIWQLVEATNAHASSI
jgi:hypothetical protein